MKNLILFMWIATFLFFPPLLPIALPHGATGETSRAQVGADFAVIAFDPQKGFQLGDAAKTRMKLKLKTISAATSQRIPLEALVEVRGATKVFRIRDAWVSRVPVTILGRKGSDLTVQGAELKEGDEIVIRGAPLLRVTELDLTAGLKDKHPEEDMSDKHQNDSPDDHHKHEAAEDHHDEHLKVEPAHDHGEEDYQEHPEPKGHHHD